MRHHMPELFGVVLGACAGAILGALMHLILSILIGGVGIARFPNFDFVRFSVWASPLAGVGVGIIIGLIRGMRWHRRMDDGHTIVEWQFAGSPASKVIALAVAGAAFAIAVWLQFRPTGVLIHKCFF
jgi:hypothetical protein